MLKFQIVSIYCDFLNDIFASLNLLFTTPLAIKLKIFSLRSSLVIFRTYKSISDFYFQCDNFIRLVSKLITEWPPSSVEECFQLQVDIRFVLHHFYHSDSSNFFFVSCRVCTFFLGHQDILVKYADMKSYNMTAYDGQESLASLLRSTQECNKTISLKSLLGT